MILSHQPQSFRVITVIGINNSGLNLSGQ